MRIRLQTETLGLLAGVVGLHVVILSFAIGSWVVAYLVAAYLSGVVIWGGVRVSGVNQRVGPCVGVAFSMAAHQAAYYVWKADLVGVWLAAGQFFAVQMVAGAAASRAIDYASNLGRTLGGSSCTQR